MTANFNFYNYEVNISIPSNELSYVDISSGHLTFTGTPILKLVNTATGNLKYTFESTMNLYFNLVSEEANNSNDAELVKLQLHDVRMITFKYLENSKEKMGVSFIS